LFSWNMFKGWLLISNYTLHKYLICWLNQLHVNYKHMSFNLLSLCIIPRYWKLSDFFCMNYILSIHTLNNICSIHMNIVIYEQYHIYIVNIHTLTIYSIQHWKWNIHQNQQVYIIFYQCCVYEIRTRFNKFILNIKFINI